MHFPRWGFALTVGLSSTALAAPIYPTGTTFAAAKLPASAIRQLPIEAEKATSILLDPSGRWLLLGEERSFRLVELTTRRILFARSACAKTYAFSADGKRFSWCGGGTVEEVELPAARVSRPDRLHARDLFYTGDSLVVLSDENQLVRFRNGRRVRALPMLSRARRVEKALGWQAYRCVCRGARVAYLINGGRDSTFECTLDLPTGKIVDGLHNGGADGIESVSWSPDRRLLRRTIRVLPADGVESIVQPTEGGWTGPTLLSTTPSGTLSIACNERCALIELPDRTETRELASGRVTRIEKTGYDYAQFVGGSNHVLIRQNGRLYEWNLDALVNGVPAR